MPTALARAARRTLDALPHLGEDPLAARRRVFGAAWVDAVEEIRRRVPEDAAYALIDAQPVEEGAIYWVRFDLAPRRALFLGRQRNLPGPQRLQSRIPAGVRWVVVASGSAMPPKLLIREELLREAARRRQHRRGVAPARPTRRRVAADPQGRGLAPLASMASLTKYERWVDREKGAGSVPRWRVAVLSPWEEEGWDRGKDRMGAGPDG